MLLTYYQSKTINLIRVLSLFDKETNTNIFGIDLNPYPNVSVGIRKNAIEDFKLEITSLKRQLKDIYKDNVNPVEYIKTWITSQIKKYQSDNYDLTYKRVKLRLYSDFNHYIDNIRGMI